MNLRNLIITSACFCLLFSKSFSHNEILKYKADAAIAKNKHIVLLANDHEYRSEEAIPALARILTKHHGFDCSVVFGIDESGNIKAGSNHMPGMEVLNSADGVIIFTRFLDLPDAQMKPLDDYLKKGGPILGLRTSTHAFNIKKNSKTSYGKYHFRYNKEDFKGGFGEYVLGQSWVGHYGRNHVQSTRIDLIEDKKNHPILKGVKDVWVQAGGYNAEPQEDWDILAMAQPLLNMKPDGENDPEKPAMAGHWTRHYNYDGDKKARVVTSLYGASEDFLNEGYRRLIVNSTYWILNLEDQIKADSEVSFVGPYKPTTFKNGAHLTGLKPSMYEGFESQIPGEGAPANVK